MQRIQLDFVRARRPHWAGWLVLVIGLLCATAAVGWHQWVWQAANDAAAVRLLKIQSALEARRTSAPGNFDAQLLADWKRAITIADRLNQPWERLFETFEAEVKQPVVILSLAPDAGSHEIVVTGEARNLEAMLANFRRLQQQEIFSGLMLHTHQINQQDREKPIRFRITAKWMIKS